MTGKLVRTRKQVHVAHLEFQSCRIPAFNQELLGVPDFIHTSMRRSSYWIIFDASGNHTWARRVQRWTREQNRYSFFFFFLNQIQEVLKYLLACLIIHLLLLWKRQFVFSRKLLPPKCQQSSTKSISLASPNISCGWYNPGPCWQPPARQDPPGPRRPHSPSAQRTRPADGSHLWQRWYSDWLRHQKGSRARGWWCAECSQLQGPGQFPLCGKRGRELGTIKAIKETIWLFKGVVKKLR